ncbi:type I-B CRISPR-associated protein Cas5b [Thermincola potens]|uniref:CRISPR-associated protein Cas5, Hmari subtype n=1 Tax=Thermincola potens (strain JR) TaxID=635013 RepID=D5XAX5_THEPJ|nr:type I-B CRISPR-associated protein Cas5b [Thermincola potens]ADG83329.1 CRISPR-associated protein Cas5, Hmari subtype [Thermincola potens JR]
MAIAFNIAGPIAMYRRPYTTTSSVSFPLPPPSAVAGLLAGIVGLGNGSHEESCASEYWEEIKGTRIAIAILNPISWYTGTVNFWNLKEPQKSPHIRVKHQFVKNPKYRIYVHGGVEKELRRHLEAGTFIYTPCLGTAYALAEIEYLGYFDIQPVTENKINLSSVLPLLPEHTIEIDIIASKGVFRDKLPFRLTPQRALAENITTLYSASVEGKICLTAWEGLDVTYFGDECIAWFPSW